MCNCITMAIEGPHSLLNGHHVNCEDNKKQTYYSIKEEGEPAIIIPAEEYEGYLADSDSLIDDVVVTEISMSKTQFDALPEYIG